MKEEHMHKKAKSIALCGVLGAMALVLSFLEGALPPIPGLPPGARLGLSNIVTMFTAGAMGLPYALCIALIKGGFSFLTRGVTAGIMSMLGGIMSTLAMWIVWKKTSFSLIFTGVCGALAHNTAQFFVSLLLTGVAAVFYIPSMLLMSVLTGACSGTVLKMILPALQRIPNGFKKD